MKTTGNLAKQAFNCNAQTSAIKTKNHVWNYTRNFQAENEF